LGEAVLLLDHSLSICMDCGEQTFNLRSHYDERGGDHDTRKPTEEESDVWL